MSVTTYYGRLSSAQYEAMREDPDGLAQFVTGMLPREQLLYLDKATPVIAWLLSPLKRREQAHFAAVCRAEEPGSSAPDLGPAHPMDDILVAIEGCGAKDERLDVGMGPACVLSPEDVYRYARMLAGIDELRLRRDLDFQQLEDAALPVDSWLEEGEENFSEYVLPLFQQLQAFFQTAASANQLVLVWYN